jgi:outer membrane biosynthesis protein TonB
MPGPEKSSLRAARGRAHALGMAVLRPRVVLVMALAFALPTLAMASCKKDEETEETIEEPTPDTETEEGPPTVEPTEPVASDLPPEPVPATPTPTPTPAPTPTPTPTTRDAGVADAATTTDAGRTADAGANKSQQCLTQCQAALQGCLVPKPGELPDAAKCQAGFESCRKACF